MAKYTWNMIFRDFKQRHPELCERGMSFVPKDFMTLTIYIPNRGKLTYQWFGDLIEWEEHWEDPKQKKAEEREKRPELYQWFLSEMHYYQRQTESSQGTIAAKTGLSRKSINKYLSGIVMPKVSTMQKICEALDIEFWKG